MEFLYKLYSNNYFGIGLFIVITILAFLFLVILFFGKKDEKARNKIEKIEKEEKIEKTELIEENTGILEPIALEQTINSEEIPEEKPEEFEVPTEVNPIIEEEPILEPIQEEIISFEETPREEMDPFVTSNIVLNTDYINEEPITKEEDFSLDNDIYNLDSLMKEEQEENKEETIDDVLNKYDAIEETMLEEPVTEIEEEINISNLEENTELDVFSKPEESRKTSTPFSSVYLTKDEAALEREEENNAQVQMPSRPKFDLPKKVDLPKRSDTIIQNTNIISNIEENSYKTKE